MQPVIFNELVPASPLYIKPLGRGRLRFKIHYKDRHVHRGSYICWGFLYCKNSIDTYTDGLGMKDSVSISYYLSDLQYNTARKQLPAREVTEYLRVLQEAGVAQWFDKVPKVLADYKGGVQISTEYPSSMMIGLLEMYRDVIYHPTYCRNVVLLHKAGIGAAASLLIPKLVSLGNAPSSDAFLYNFRSDSGNNLRCYFTDLFSSERLHAKLKQGRASARDKPNFKGVHLFFMDRSVRARKPLLQLRKDVTIPWRATLDYIKVPHQRVLTLEQAHLIEKALTPRLP